MSIGPSAPRRLPFLLVAALSAAAVAAAGDAPAATPRIEQLAGLMAGSFSSGEQAAADQDFFDIRLHMARIWPGRTDGPWLYVEQVAAASLDKPYRQRIYRLAQEERDGAQAFSSQVYELPGDPLAWAGAWSDPARFDSLAPDALQARTGCAVILRDRGDAFEGSTDGRSCLSSLRGAQWATSEVRITPAGIESWDRGWDADGKQVWGAVKSGYLFKRLPPS